MRTICLVDATDDFERVELEDALRSAGDRHHHLEQGTPIVLRAVRDGELVFEGRTADDSTDLCKAITEICVN